MINTNIDQRLLLTVVNT